MSKNEKNKEKGKAKKQRVFSNDFNTLMAHPEMVVYREPERKLDAKDEIVLGRVERHIFHSAYYLPVNDPNSDYDIPDGIHITVADANNIKVRPAREDTPRRYRVYYDTPKLEAFNCGVEIRIEFPKPTEHGHAKPFKQVIKLGGPANEDDPTFHRIEIPGRLARPSPSFDAAALDGNKRLATFLETNIDLHALRPLQLLPTVRTRYPFRPGGMDGTIVEMGFDRGRGITLTNFRYPIWQIEPEVLRGDEAILEGVTQKLQSRFNGDELRLNFNSKPTPGFEVLGEVLADNKKARDFLLDLPQGEFRIIQRDECPALFGPAI